MYEDESVGKILVDITWVPWVERVWEVPSFLRIILK